MEILKAVKTYIFINKLLTQPKIKISEIKDFIIEEYGNELYLKIKSGEKEVKSFLIYLNLPEEKQKKVISIFNKFLDKVRKK